MEMKDTLVNIPKLKLAKCFGNEIIIIINKGTQHVTTFHDKIHHILKGLGNILGKSQRRNIPRVSSGRIVPRVTIGRITPSG